jgi:hypothetical protein
MMLRCAMRGCAVRISHGALDEAFKHVEARGDTDVLPPAFENEAIRREWGKIKPYLAAAELENWPVRPLRQCLAPKRRLGLRVVTQLDPLDTLLITALVYEMGEAIERARVPQNAEIVHSYRFQPGPAGQFFDPMSNFDSFRARSLELASSNAGYVVMTDIADFFPRIYSHPLENAIEEYVGRGYAGAVKRLLMSWNSAVSHGLPVGPTAFRLLADLSINDVDQTLLADGLTFCRYSDDFRIFVRTEGQARKALALLANTLFHNHGLTIQESKTEICSTEDFLLRFASTEEDNVQRHREEWLGFLIENLGFEDDAAVLDMYENVTGFDYDHLTEEQQEAIDHLNLWDALNDELNRDAAANLRLVQFILRQSRSLGLLDDSGILLRRLPELSFVFSEALEALAAQKGLDSRAKKAAGDALLDRMTDDILGSLEYFQAWMLWPLTLDGEWCDQARLIRSFDSFPRRFTSPSLTLALGRAGADFWFRNRRADQGSLGGWERRAFLYGASCMRTDETEHWYHSVKPTLDELEKAVVELGRSAPLRDGGIS